MKMQRTTLKLLKRIGSLRDWSFALGISHETVRHLLKSRRGCELRGRMLWIAELCIDYSARVQRDIA